jgi:hypothetical protein
MRNDDRTWSLCVQLDMETIPPSVKDVEVMIFNGNPAYEPHAGYKPGTPNHQGHGPRAVLAEVTGRSRQEAEHAIKGIIENEPHLAWVKDYDSIQRFLAPPWPDPATQKRVIQQALADGKG